MAKIANVRLDKPVEFYGFVNKDGFSQSIGEESYYIMPVEEAEMFVGVLKSSNKLS